MISIYRTNIPIVPVVENVDDSEFTTSQHFQMLEDALTAALASDILIEGKFYITRAMISRFGFLPPEDDVWNFDVQQVGQITIGDKNYLIYADVDQEDDTVLVL